LLGVTVDVERASKPTPIVTQEYTDSLEELILGRVKAGKFDDVIPREIREKHGATEREDFMLSQEKSKQGLGDIYADDFLEKSMQVDGSAGAREQETKDKEEVSGLFAKVCRQLDALSHFHYAPKPIVAEASVTSSAPSIMMEDVGPTSESMLAVSGQAPEEVMSHKRGRDAAFLSAEELTGDDKKRLRRAAKMVRRKTIRGEEAEEKQAAKVNPALGRKYDAKVADKAMKRDRRVVDASSTMKLESDEKVKSFTKSANFFSALQKQSEEDIQRKRDGGGKKGKRSDIADSSTSTSKGASLKL
jgi:U3 small nucleolar RNA-associated protein MPP10